ncbi:MAG: helix-turn-helix domain-containing protein [Phycisphaeraceae bacterium]
MKTGKSHKEHAKQSLGDFLAYIRTAKKMTLREVEQASDKQISNAYLSQLERGRITKPSPSVLHTLAGVYGVPYETLMEKAGYIMPSSEREEGQAHGRVATVAGENLSPEEEEELLRYLAFLRSRRGSGE